MTNYSFSKTSALPFTNITSTLKSALEEKGFGVLTERNASAKMKEKLNEDMRPYVILGVCHSPSAFKALVNVATIRPSIAMAMIENPKLTCLAQDAEEISHKVIRKIQ